MCLFQCVTNGNADCANASIEEANIFKLTHSPRWVLFACGNFIARTDFLHPFYVKRKAQKPKKVKSKQKEQTLNLAVEKPAVFFESDDGNIMLDEIESDVPLPGLQTELDFLTDRDDKIQSLSFLDESDDLASASPLVPEARRLLKTRTTAAPWLSCLAASLTS
jgi:hypothetical protein